MEATPVPAADARRPRRVVASYDDYRGAERAVDFLSDKGFPVERVAIVGTGLQMVEQVAGRVTTARAARGGALQGATLGLVFALLIGLFFDVSGGFIGLLLYALVTGALIGALLGGLSHAGLRGRRDFASIGGMEAESYEIHVDADVADRANELLLELGS